MPVSVALQRYIPPFFKKIFPLGSQCHIQKLPLDIWVDRIIPFLPVEDVICLRRVNKTLFLITHEPVIWKRFLMRLHIPIPPLRPSLRWSLDLNNFQIEQMVVKAICADDNWRRLSPKLGYTRAQFAYWEVLEMKLLPGGQYMVASVKDTASRVFYLCIFYLDHPERNLPPLAKLPLPSKAINIEARFQTLRDRHGIMILYSIRGPEDGQLHGYDLNALSSSAEIDPPFPLRHECICTFVDMAPLELLSDPSVSLTSPEYRRRAAALPKPFQLVIHFVSNAPIEHPSLFEGDGYPFAAVVQKPNEIVLMDLTSSQLSSIKLARIANYNTAEHKIRAIRVLPKQNQVLVVRTLLLRRLGEEQDYHTVELHTLPDLGQLGVVRNAPEQYFTIENRNASSIHISDMYEPVRGNDHPFLYDPDARPMPLSIYVCGEGLEGMENVNIPPDQYFDGKQLRWYYPLTHWHEQQTICDERYHVRILPGVRRALLYKVPVDDRSDLPKIKELGRYYNPCYTLDDYPHDPEFDPPHPDEKLGMGIVRRRYQRPPNEYVPFKFRSSTFEHIAKEGFSAMTWDESTGRVCIATPKNMKFLVMDVRMGTSPDDRFAQWKRVQAMMNSEPEAP
ncbi:hypothetical protein D9757_008411 [Collybiopsis confluens]|uniref:F-box domain-containing protein n=1 Tax=Collybiopsis confluens TaxID=2823264 RepID=A0A8H5HHN6_9AGAR|nr:hypothetical protein D9757_013337 [Collybiopsis confluens]KAF5383336.1 hypothetical protein D9757_008411 [Collybiopsis confluens]